MALLTPAQVREHVETDLPDTALQRLMDDGEQEIVQRFGELAAQTDNILIGDPHEFPFGRDKFIFPSRPIAGVTSITEQVHDGEQTLLAADDYRLLDGGRSLERLHTGPNPRFRWADRVILVYTPRDETAMRTRVLIDLVKLAVQYNALSSENAGDYSSNSVEYQAEREKILRTLRLRGGLGAMV